MEKILVRHGVNENPYLQLLKKALPWILFLGLLFLTAKSAHAQGYLGEGWDNYLGDVEGYGVTGKTGEELATNFILNAVRIVRNIIGVAALIFGVIYGLKLVMSRGQDDSITKQKMNFLYALMGFGIIIIAENIAGIFNPETSTNAQIIDFNAARDQLRDIVSYLKWLLGSVIVLMMTISGVRMITAQGDEETITSQKRNLTWSGIGMLIILLASNIVNAVYVLNSPDEAVAAGPQQGISEIAGLIKLVLVFLGPIAILFTIYAGFMYLTSLDNEDRAEKGKRMIVAGITAIVIIYAAYAIVNTLTTADLAFINPFIA